MLIDEQNSNSGSGGRKQPFGDGKSFQGIFGEVDQRVKYLDEVGRLGSATGIRGVIDLYDDDNPYRPMAPPKDSEDKHIASTSAVTASTASTAGQSAAGVAVAHSELSDCEDVGTEFCRYQKSKNPLHSMSSVFACKESAEESHLEFAPNVQKYLYDDAVEELRENSRGLMVDKLTSLQHHVNTWGLSSNKYFAENLITKMGNLN